MSKVDDLCLEAGPCGVVLWTPSNGFQKRTVDQAIAAAWRAEARRRQHHRPTLEIAHAEAVRRHRDTKGAM